MVRVAALCGARQSRYPARCTKLEIIYKPVRQTRSSSCFHAIVAPMKLESKHKTLLIFFTLTGLSPSQTVTFEVYADENTTADEMFEQGKDMFTWIPNPERQANGAGAHIKYPITKAGLD